jgi:hypothetical protein
MFAQGPRFTLRGKNKFKPMENGVNYLHDGVLRESRGLIVLQTYLSHAKGANPRSYFSFTKATRTFNDFVCHFMRELDWTGCVCLSTMAWVRTCKNKGDKNYRLTIILSDPLFLVICYETIWREPKKWHWNLWSILWVKKPHKGPFRQ